MDADRGMTPCLDPRKNRPLDRDRHPCGFVIKRRKCCPHLGGCVVSNFDRQRALSGGGRPFGLPHRLEREARRIHLSIKTQQPQTRETCRREDNPFELSVAHTGESGVHVAPDVERANTWVTGAQLGDPAGRARADDRIRTEVLQSGAAGDDDVARVFALRDSRQPQAGRIRRRKIFELVHEQVALPSQQCLAQSRGKDSGSAERCEGGA